MGVSVDTNPPSPIDDDLRSIYTGGDNFLARMSALAEARTAHDKALAALNLGNDVAARMDDVRSKQEAINADRAQAAKLLADAETAATAIVATAKAEATEHRAAAQTAADQLAASAALALANAEKVNSAAQADYKQIVAGADELRKRAAEELASATTALTGAERSKQALDAKQEQLDAKLAELQKAHDQLTMALGVK